MHLGHVTGARRGPLKLGHVLGTDTRSRPCSVAADRITVGRWLVAFTQIKKLIRCSDRVVRGGVEPATFRFSGVADCLFG